MLGSPEYDQYVNFTMQDFMAQYSSDDQMQTQLIEVRDAVQGLVNQNGKGFDQMMNVVLKNLSVKAMELVDINDKF